jgi:hypothetical protein
MELGLGPLPMLKTFGQGAVLRAWRDSEGTCDWPLGWASALGHRGFQFRRFSFPIMRVH